MTLAITVLFLDGVKLESPESSLSSGVKFLDYTVMIAEGEPGNSAVAKWEVEGGGVKGRGRGIGRGRVQRTVFSIQELTVYLTGTQ